MMPLEMQFPPVYDYYMDESIGTHTSPSTDIFVGDECIFSTSFDLGFVATMRIRLKAKI
jgi:hypothetical protein